ncbi:MAG: DUF1631 family protein [Pseudomonadota bacterium]
MSEVIEKLKQQATKELTRLVQGALEATESSPEASWMSLIQKKDDVMFNFMENMEKYFDELDTGQGSEEAEDEDILDYEKLSLMQDDDLDIMVAFDGMIASSRNKHLPNFISFNTRLNAIAAAPRVDESTNPLDPQQVATAFKDALVVMDLLPTQQLAIFRLFNEYVLDNLGDVLSSANGLLIEHGIIPDLGVDAGKGGASSSRSRRRGPSDATGFGTVEAEDLSQPEDNPELFNMMQNLLHADSTPSTESGGQTEVSTTIPGPAPTQQFAIPSTVPVQGNQPAPFQNQNMMQPYVPRAGEQIQMVDQTQLMDILSKIQQVLELQTDRQPGAAISPEINKNLAELLQATTGDGMVGAIDGQSSDIINLVTMLYEAIWADYSVPIPIKELIGRTQITIMKVALSDTDFFNKENHPARMVLNEFAEAGIGWTEVEDLDGDPLYGKISELVNRVLEDYQDENESFFEEVLRDFRTFRAKEEASETRKLEQRILRSDERQERVDDIKELVTERINERILGREIHDFVRELLETHFHKFMVMLVLKEGPGTNAWKQAINTIDVLLWSVQGHEHEGDRDRLEVVNPRLLNNLRKAMKIAQLDSAEIDNQITRLKEVQEETFSRTEAAAMAALEPAADSEVEDNNTPVHSDVLPDLPEDDPYMMQADSLQVGIWVEFSGDEEDVSVRCKLAAKINAIDKYIFVNRQGVKVVEKTKMGLARELSDGTVKVISDGLLFSRALESVIGNLRDSADEQRTGSAYQPDTA